MEEVTVILKKGEGRTIKAGGAWIYDNEIDRIMGKDSEECREEDPIDGQIVDVQDFDGYPMGKGFLNRKSKITVRMMTRDPGAVIDDDFLYRRVRAAWEYRKAVTDTSACRIIFGDKSAEYDINVFAFVLGDVTMNGSVDIKDLTRLARHVASIEEIKDPDLLRAGNVTRIKNGDSDVNIQDLTTLARHVANIELLPVGC